MNELIRKMETFFKGKGLMPSDKKLEFPVLVNKYFIDSEVGALDYQFGARTDNFILTVQVSRMKKVGADLEQSYIDFIWGMLNPNVYGAWGLNLRLTLEGVKFEEQDKKVIGTYSIKGMNYGTV